MPFPNVVEAAEAAEVVVEVDVETVQRRREEGAVGALAVLEDVSSITIQWNKCLLKLRIETIFLHLYSGDGLKGPFEACEEDVSPDDLECGDDQKAMVFPNAACEDLSVGDSFPSKREIKDDNPCVESEVCWSLYKNIYVFTSLCCQAC